MAQDPGAHPQLFIRNILSPEGRGFPSKGKFYFAVAEGREGISSEDLQLMKSSTQGNTNCLKSRGWFFLEHLDC